MDSLDRKVERLENEKQALIDHRKEHTEQVEYVEKERPLTEKKAQGGLVTRTKWWVTGVPVDD